MGNTILIVEDDTPLRKSLVKYFSVCGFTVYSAGSCPEAVELVFRHLPDCFLLDYHLGDETALLICLSVRGCTQLREAPIVILSGDEQQVADCYDSCQADAFVLKGHGHKAALAAIQRQLRRVGKPCEPQPSDLVLDHKGQRVIRNGATLAKLSPEQFKLFSFLFENRPRCVPGSEIIAQVFTEPPRDLAEALAALVYRLRQTLGHPYARRIARKKGRGWAYIQPRQYTKTPV
ncbi:MAG: response regulator transcription factor [Elusimicrobia bacterium]|nr:response regulator transcription factor [Elusimicrobiota bacterium]